MVSKAAHETGGLGEVDFPNTKLNYAFFLQKKFYSEFFFRQKQKEFFFQNHLKRMLNKISTNLDYIFFCSDFDDNFFSIRFNTF